MLLFPYHYADKLIGDEGLSCLVEKSHARHDQAPMIDEIGCGRLLELVRLSPRTFGHHTSVWTRPLLAHQLHKEGHTSQQGECDID
jgi:hypothetical protein